MKIIITALALFVSLSVQAFEFPKVEDAWLRAAPPNVKMMAAYLKIENTSQQDKTLIGAFSPAFGMAEIHRSIEKDGVYRMEEQKQLMINSGEQLTFKPGGLHIMLMMPKAVVKLGESVRICLIYQGDQGEKEVQHIDFPVLQDAPERQ